MEIERRGREGEGRREEREKGGEGWNNLYLSVFAG
jgi:hypothetical protein